MSWNEQMVLLIIAAVVGFVAASLAPFPLDMMGMMGAAWACMQIGRLLEREDRREKEESAK